MRAGFSDNIKSCKVLEKPVRNPVINIIIISLSATRELLYHCHCEYSALI